VTPDEDKQLRLLGDALQVVREWEDLTGRPNSLQPVPGSELAEDDRRTHPYRVSDAVRGAMTAAIDHLGCLHDSLFKWSGSDRVIARIHIYGQFALVRGALENASRAVWMLELDDRDERVLRRLQLEWSEVCAQEHVRNEMGPPGRSMSDRFDDLTVLIQPTGIDPDEIRLGARYATMVKAAGAHFAADGSRQVVIWRMCSALSHGDFRGTLGYTDRQVLGEISPGIALNKVTGSVPLLTRGSLDAIDTMRVALRLHGRRTM
jgi:hypothetical protein